MPIPGIQTQNKVIFKGHHCLIPASLRQTIMEGILNSHLSFVAYWQKARMSVFWPGIIADIKDYVQTWDTCKRLFPNTQRKEPLLQYDRPDRPWAKLPADLFSLGEHIFRILITTVYWSNYFEIDEFWQTTSWEVIRCLQRHLATDGILEGVVTDKGPQFRSRNFQAFSNTSMFKHTNTSPYHSQANGSAESSVKTSKKILKAAMANGEDA